MALFRRNKTQTTDVPSEVQDYYQAENRERSWIAWALGLGTLLATVLVVSGLFFGGRWVYRKTRNQSKPATTASVQQESQSQSSEPSSPAVSNPQTSSDNTPTPSTTPQPSSTSPSNSSSNLPNTGPGDTLAIFLAISVLAYMAHRRYLVSR